MNSIFKKIIDKEIPAHIIYENEEFISFLDISPLAKGHTLVVPKKEIDKIFELDSKTYISLMQLSYKLANAIEKTIPCLRVGMAVIGLEIPHAHVHLVPLNNMEDLNFTKPRESYTETEFFEIANKIKKSINF